MHAFENLPVDHDTVSALSRALGVHHVTAQVLVKRGIDDAEQARRFLRPGPDQLHDPFLFQDMEAAVTRILSAIAGGERIVVYGDYDVDGVTATTVLLRTLRFLGGDAHAFIPERLREGYGLNAEALLALGEEGCDLVVTVDNGTTRPREIAAAKARGLDIIVTDHHEPGEALPDCPVINPKRADSTYPFQGLAGCGVSFKLAAALAERSGRMHTETFRRLLPDLLATVAIGTVADVVPLKDENRSLVALGLKALQATRHAGLRALLDVARCGKRPVSPTDVGYRIGPRINAAGRLGSAGLALELFLCDEPKTAGKLARELDACNQERQLVEREQWDEARERASGIVAARDPSALVLAGDGWHAGVIGIVAARAAETFHRPAALIAIEGDRARGSARTFGGVALHEALEACSDLLLTHGGHAAAAGFTLDSSRVDEFAAAFERAVLTQSDGVLPPRRVDAELPIDAISAPLAQEIELLQPFGAGNREPVFCAYDVRAAGRARRMGNEERHLAFYAASDRTSVRAVAFNQADREGLLKGRFDLAFVLRRREGPEPVELIVRDIVPHEPA